MKSASTSKTTIVIIVVCVIIVLMYFYFEGGSPAVSGSLLESSGSATVGSAELSLLNQIQSLKIDTSFFSDPVYQSLRDFSVQIPPENVGRPNPFAPIPGVSNPTATGVVNPR